MTSCEFSKREPTEAEIDEMVNKLNQALPDYIDKKSTRNKVIDWYKRRTKIADLSKGSYNKLNYFFGEPGFLSRMELSGDDFSKTEKKLKSLGAQDNYTDKMNKFYHAIINKDNPEEKLFLFRTKPGIKYQYLYSTEKRFKKLYILDTQDKIIYFYCFQD